MKASPKFNSFIREDCKEFQDLSVEFFLAFTRQLLWRNLTKWKQLILTITIILHCLFKDRCPGSVILLREISSNFKFVIDPEIGNNFFEPGYIFTKKISIDL